MESVLEEILLEICRWLDRPIILWRVCKYFRSFISVNETILSKTPFTEKEIDWFKQTGMRFGMFFTEEDGFTTNIQCHYKDDQFKDERYDGYVFGEELSIIDLSPDEDERCEDDFTSCDLSTLTTNISDVFTILTLHHHRLKKLSIPISTGYANKQALLHFNRSFEIVAGQSRAAIYFYLKMCCHVKNLPTGVITPKLVGDYTSEDKIQSALDNLSSEVEAAIVKMTKRILNTLS